MNKLKQTEKRLHKTSMLYAFLATLTVIATGAAQSAALKGVFLGATAILVLLTAYYICWHAHVIEKLNKYRNSGVE